MKFQSYLPFLLLLLISFTQAIKIKQLDESNDNQLSFPQDDANLTEEEIQKRADMIIQKFASNQDPSQNVPEQQPQNIERFVEQANKYKEEYQRQRYTIEGKKCAPYSRVGGNNHPGCVKTQDPSGGNTNQEWCYIDPSEKSTKKWDFCKINALDYDELRKVTIKLLQSQKLLMNQMFNKLTQTEQQTTTIIKLIQEIDRTYPQVHARLEKHIEQVKRIEANYLIIIQQIQSRKVIIKKILKLQQEIKELKSQEKQKDPKNCNGMLGYETESPGDGLIAYYYDNEIFKGQYVKQIEKNVDMYWPKSPLIGLNQDNYSIKLFGWLRIPRDGKYKLITRTDQGLRLLLNGQVIIQQNFNTEKGSWLQVQVQNGNIGVVKDPRSNEIYSNEQSLKGGQKYKIQIEFVRTNQKRHENSIKPFLQLYWENEIIEKQIIESQFFYQKNENPPAKAANFNPDLFELKVLKEQIFAFKDEQSYILDDIPIQFQGSQFLRSVYNYKEESIKIGTDSNIDIYIAVQNLPNQKLLPKYFEDTMEVLSVLQIKEKKVIKKKAVNDDGEQEQDMSKLEFIKASESHEYKIYKKSFQKGDIEIPLIGTAGNHFVLFFTMQSSSASQLSCGGDEVLLSDPQNAQIFKDCSQSSRFGDVGWDCRAAFNQQMEDNRQSMWATDHQGIGSWIKLNLKSPFIITKIEFKQKQNSMERNQLMEVEFDDNKVENIEAKNILNLQTFKLESEAITKNVKIKVKSVFGTINNGGAFKIYGVPCMESKSEQLNKGEPVVQSSYKEDLKNKVFKLECKDSILNNDNLRDFDYNDGDQFKIDCQDNCQNYENVNVYGDMIYSDDSSLCKAAIHSGALTGKGITGVKISINTDDYKGSTRMGIQSRSRTKSKISVIFEHIQKEKPKIHDVKEGQLVDYFDKSSSKWLEGRVLSAKIVSSSLTNVEVLVDGQNKPIQGSFPSDVIDFCGNHIKDRKCDKASVDPNKEANQQIMINFGKDKIQGYTLDDGKQFSKQGNYEYGWSLDNAKNARKRKSNGNNMLNNLMLFPPNPVSKYCKDASPDSGIDCKQNFWKIKVKPGHYNIKVNVGDPDYASKYDISVQRKNIFSKFLKKNQFSTAVANNVNAISGEIIISNDCQENCEYSWSRMTSIEIKKVIEEKNQEDEESNQNTNQLGCGLAFTGGRCLGGKDIENCIYDSTDSKGVQGCYANLQLVFIGNNYQCNQQRGKHKCIKKQFENREQCIESCPGPCNGQICGAKKEAIKKADSKKENSSIKQLINGVNAVKNNVLEAVNDIKSFFK